MFEYILAGFTGSFFSYFCVYWVGAESHALAVSSVSENILRKMKSENEMIIRNMEINYKALKTKMDEIIHKLDIQNDWSNSSSDRRLTDELVVRRLLTSKVTEGHR